MLEVLRLEEKGDKISRLYSVMRCTAVVGGLQTIKAVELVTTSDLTFRRALVHMKKKKIYNHFRFIRHY